jgi:hypothetical protein
MAGLNEDAQWIVLMGFLVSFGLFFLGMLLNQSVVVGQTTAEGVLDFPKNDIRDVKDVIIETEILNRTGKLSSNPVVLQNQLSVLRTDIESIALSRKKAVVSYTVIQIPNDVHTYIQFHYNNGVTEYNEYWTSP